MNNNNFWTPMGKILPSRLYNFLSERGIGIYYPKNCNERTTLPITVVLDGRIVSEVNEHFLLSVAKDYIVESIADPDFANSILDNLHRNIQLFGDRNQRLLRRMDLNFIEDNRECAHLFFRNVVLRISAAGIEVIPIGDLEGYLWSDNIIPFEFRKIDNEGLLNDFSFNEFLKDLTLVENDHESIERLMALRTILGYLSHRYKDATLTRAIILMDAKTTGGSNGRTGKTLLCNAVGRIRKIDTLDGKNYDPRRWYRFSGIGYDTDIMLFDDIARNFNFEHLYPLMTTGLSLQRKYKDDVFIPFEDSPKVVITTNYAVNGEGSSFRGRTFEFEISNTYSADYQPIDKFKKRFFDDWDDEEWNSFYNLMALCIVDYLRHGLIPTKSINLKLTKLINATNEDFVDFAEGVIKLDVEYDKRELFFRFRGHFPEYSIAQRTFTDWLRAWGSYKGYVFSETHSNVIRTITYSKKE